MNAALLSLALAASSFQPNSPVPAQLQALVLEVLPAKCGEASWSEQTTNVESAGGETYYQTKFARDGGEAKSEVISAVARMGGMAVINVDCGE